MRIAPKKLLISSAGRRVELINIFRHEANLLGIPLTIIAIDFDPNWSPACLVADKTYTVPKVTDDNFASTVLEICINEKVDLIIPTIDTELFTYAMNKDVFQKMGIRIVVSDPDTIRIFRDKYQTFQILKNLNIPTPQTWLSSEIKKEIPFCYPLIAKPKNGSSSKGVIIIHSNNELLSLLEKSQDYIIQEKLNGEEYTVNAYVSQIGQLISATPHFRKLIRSGEVCFGETRKIIEFEQIAERIVNGIKGIEGPICFQGFISKRGEVSIIEINGRFGGGYPIAHQAGNKMATWLLQEISGLQPQYTNEWQTGLKMLRYDAAFFSN